MFQLSGDGSDLVVNPHLHDGGSVFSREVAIAMSRGKTIPEGQILHLVIETANPGANRSQRHLIGDTATVEAA